MVVRWKWVRCEGGSSLEPGVDEGLDFFDWRFDFLGRGCFMFRWGGCCLVRRVSQYVIHF